MALSPAIIEYAEQIGVDLDEARFPDGYAGAWRSLDEISSRASVQRLNPVFRDMFMAAMLFCYAIGIAYGIGGAARDEASQLAEFYRRHTTTPNGNSSRWFNGKRYYLRPGMAPYAPPGSSNHEEGATPTGAVAIDSVLAASWAAANDLLHRFALKHFANVNREPWHVQPAVWGNSRSAVNAAIARGERLTLPGFPLPDGGVVTPPDPTQAPPPPKTDDPEARMVTVTATMAELREGTRGRDVARAQALANALSGSTLATDGHYGPKSVAQIKLIQKFVGLVDDGIVGPKTWAILVDS